MSWLADDINPYYCPYGYSCPDGPLSYCMYCSKSSFNYLDEEFENKNLEEVEDG